MVDAEWLAKPKIYTIWPFGEKVCRAVLHVIILTSKDLLGLILLSHILTNSRPILSCSGSGLGIFYYELILLGPYLGKCYET